MLRYFQNLLPNTANNSLTILNLNAQKLLQHQQTRNTFILKRRWEPKLAKKNEKISKLRGRHYNYDLIEDTNVKRKPNMEVVLTKFVEGIGRKGDVVSVRPIVAYNDLLLPGLAVYKTEENIEKYTRTQDEDVEDQHSSPFAQRTVNMLECLTLAVIMNKDVPWVIQPWHIKASLRKAGFHAVEEAIKLPETPITGPDLLKQNKEFYVTVTVNNMEKARVKCRIHHWSTDPSERLPYVFEHWKEPSEPLFGSSQSPESTKTESETK